MLLFLWLHRETLHSNFLPGCKKGFFSGTIPNEMTGEFWDIVCCIKFRKLLKNYFVDRIRKGGYS